MTVVRMSMKASSGLHSSVMQTLGFSLAVLLLLFSPLTRAARDIGSMRQLVWSQNTATLEFCSAVSRGKVQFGYRQPGSGASCGDLAPLIVMSPGQTYELTLTNTIASSEDPANIHTHGLHTGGDVRPAYFTGQADETPDDITVEAAPGESITYIWSIPSDHMGGTHWYHSHVHKYSNAQVDGGAFGMIIIEENGSISSDPGVNGWLDNEIVLMAGAVGNSIKGNGVDGGDVFEMVADEWYRMRV
jgi:FtsP/CotA-like multicopper oxidase with cupredoxin domain